MSFVYYLLQCHIIIIVILVYMCIGVYAHACTHVCHGMVLVREKLLELVLSFSLYLGSGDQTGPGLHKFLHFLDPFTGPDYFSVGLTFHKLLFFLDF